MYRFYEILPGALAWGTILLLLVGSRVIPQAVGIFAVLFDVYWLLKSVYLSIHMRATFSQMKENLKINWLEQLEQITYNRTTSSESITGHKLSVISWRSIRHLVIFPMCREPYEVVRESFVSLAHTTYPKEKMLVVLATEERAKDYAQEIARRICEEFKGVFGGLLVTTHPGNLEGEIPGKGSNIAWAAARAKEELLDRHKLSVISYKYENVLVSAFDIDTQVHPQYFARLAYVFLTAQDPLRAIYQPIPLFTNNIYEAPLLARVVAFSATFWQMMQQARPERLTTFSSQSMPLPVLLDVGFWQKNVVSEDSRIFWQAYLRYEGNFRVEPLHFPVMMDANVAAGFWKTMKNVYFQQRRWGWGVENVPYVLSGFFNSKEVGLPNIRKSDFRRRWYWTFHMLEGFHSWATNALILFFLGWMPTLIGGSEFRATLLSYSIPGVTRALMIAAMIGVVTAAVAALALLPPRPVWFGKRHVLLYILEWLLMPLTLIFFGALPGLEAQTRLMLGGRFRLGFWITPKMRASSK